MKSDRFKNSALLVLAAAIVAGCAPQIAVVSEKLPARFHSSSETDQDIAKDRKSHIGKLDKAWDEAIAKGWIVVSMKDDWPDNPAVVPHALR